jgi:MftR C-terminal domain
LGTDPVSDPFPAIAVAAAMGALRAAVASWEDAGRPGSLDDAVDAAFATLAAGLPGPRPRKGRR